MQTSNSNSSDSSSDSSTNSSASLPQGDQSSIATTTGRPRQAPGRHVDPKSKMSLARAFYAANVATMERSVMVQTLHENLSISKQVANTYVSNIDKQAGGKLSRRARKSA
jgi:hypothetical protein